MNFQCLVSRGRSGEIEQRLLQDRAVAAVSADTGRVMNPTVSTVGAAPHEKKLAALVASAIEIAPPERIILFGSAARGELVEDGGPDLLAVADTRTGDVWQAGSARREKRGGVGPLTSLSCRQRRSKPTGTTRAATSTIRCAKGGSSTT